MELRSLGPHGLRCGISSAERAYVLTDNAGDADKAGNRKPSNLNESYKDWSRILSGLKQDSLFM